MGRSAPESNFFPFLFDVFIGAINGKRLIPFEGAYFSHAERESLECYGKVK